MGGRHSVAGPQGATVSTPAKKDNPLDLRPRLRQRTRRLDEPILRFIAHFDVVTSHQLLHLFFSVRDKSPVYGYRVLKQLREAGLVVADTIHPELGAASLTYLRLTRAGWAAIGVRPPTGALKPLPGPHLEYKLQYVEMMTIRSPEGWREVRQENAFEILRRWGLARFRKRLLNDHEIIARSTIERMEKVRIQVPVLVNQGAGLVRLVFPAREGENQRRILRSLPKLRLFPPVEFELVASSSEMATAARLLLQRHAAHAGFRCAVYKVPRFSSRPNPRSIA